MKRCAIAVLLTLFAGVACNEIERPEEKMVPISFSAAVSDGIATRATGMIGDDASLQAGGFGVFGCYTGLHNYSESDANSSFMYNQELEWVSGDAHWEYNPVKYWPGEEGHKVSFFAYAPYSECDGTGCIPSCVRYQETADPWVMYRIAEDPAQQVDLLYATPLLDQTKMAVNERLEFTFKHALACVGDKITMKLTESLAQKLDNYAELTINSVKIDYKNLTNKARLVLKCSNMPEWREIVSGQLTVSRTLTIASPTLSGATKTTISKGKGLFYIPLQVAGTEAPVAEVTLNYTVKILGTGTVMSGTGTGTFALSLDTMEGKKQAINLNLGENIDMRHLIYQLDNDPADEPSYAPKF